MALIYYSFILVFLFVTNKFAVYNKNRHNVLSITNYKLYIPTIIISILLGIRYNLSDWVSYMKQYEAFRLNKELIRIDEPFWMGFQSSFAHLDLHYSIFFSIVIFVHIFLLYKSVFKLRPQIIPWVSFFYIIIYLTSSSNIMRQYTAVCICSFAIQFIIERKLFMFLLCIWIASNFHASAIIFLPAYFIPQIPLPNLKIQFVLLIISRIASIYVLPNLVSIVKLLKWEAFWWQIENFTIQKAHINSGIGLLLNLIVDLTVVMYSNKIISKVKQFKIIYFIFFIGLCFEQVFWGTFELNRITFYFYGTKIFCLAFLVYYLLRISHDPKDKFVAIAIIAFHLFLFTSKCLTNEYPGLTPLYFFWENDIPTHNIWHRVIQ